MGEWKHETNYDTGYDTLFDPKGGEFAILTEPEDRNWYRDGAPVVAKLNEYHAEISQLKEKLAAAEDRVRVLERALREEAVEWHRVALAFAPDDSRARDAHDRGNKLAALVAEPALSPSGDASRGEGVLSKLRVLWDQYCKRRDPEVSDEIDALLFPDPPQGSGEEPKEGPYPEVFAEPGTEPDDAD